MNSHAQALMSHHVTSTQSELLAKFSTLGDQDFLSSKAIAGAEATDDTTTDPVFKFKHKGEALVHEHEALLATSPEEHWIFEIVRFMNQLRLHGQAPLKFFKRYAAVSSKMSSMLEHKKKYTIIEFMQVACPATSQPVFCNLVFRSDGPRPQDRPVLIPWTGPWLKTKVPTLFCFVF